MKHSLDFINGFLSRAGSFVFSASVISKGLSFLASWVAIKLIPNKDLGAVIYAFQIIAFIIPIAGFGLEQGLLRYGALLKSTIEKNKLFTYTLKYGILISLILAGLIIFVTFFIDFNLEKTKYYLIFLSLALTTHYILGVIKIKTLLDKKNKLYSFIELTYNLLFVLLVFVLSYFFKELGYAIALIITPLIASLLFIHKLTFKWNESVNNGSTNFAFWKYGFFASLSNVTTQLLISIDIILIGSILNNLELVTAFKYISIIPFSFLFLSQAVMTTDFVNLTEKINDKEYIINYIKNYIKLFTLISLGCLLFIYFSGSYILTFFEKDYSQYATTLLILTIGISGILIIRGLFGNLLSSIGKAHLNFITTTIAIALNLALNYFLIPKYGINGAAITSAFLMWFTGILSCLFFFYYFNKKRTF
ncbi:Membrane protein involved in the export of O-antigen and teichoic acid [Lutibacter agarilyticus]|uniref:Membrane protein involved in the export of O-antigen and teichoic acid n=1 Tax=Lutibacter agarilyticus TaxID=1109740 RepID=A0A238WGR8_9FLAO|nr:polysaccharide biosynthesis C-terminal domain-containing protein [Lutibacter agarilyticus]SNR45796.1 Membrane protein involved in the export of O-antigen and teichoic acid [Lutibacter agarilyticus]